LEIDVISPTERKLGRDGNVLVQTF
jgi:hypothetical protein